MNPTRVKPGKLDDPDSPTLCFCGDCLKRGGRARRLLALRYLGAVRAAVDARIGPDRRTWREARQHNRERQRRYDAARKDKGHRS